MSKSGNDFVVELCGPSQKHQLTIDCHPLFPVVDSHRIGFLYIWFHSRAIEVTPAIHREELWIYIDWIWNREVHPCPFNDRQDSLENCPNDKCFLEHCSIKSSMKWIKPTSSKHTNFEAKEIDQGLVSVFWTGILIILNNEDKTKEPMTVMKLF